MKIHLTSYRELINPPYTKRDLPTIIVNQATNPFFMNEASGDYRLKNDSVAKGKGQPLPSNIANAINSGLSSPVVTAGGTIDMGAILWPGRL